MMKVRATKLVDVSGTGLREGDRLDPSETEKQQLKNQINELRALILQIEGNLDVEKFGNVEKKTKSVLPPTLDRWSSKRALETNTLFRKELHRYIGFYCAKMNKTEYIFNYKPYDKTGHNTYWVQIHNKDGKTLLGHWGLPIAIDINKILSKTPIEKLTMVLPFLKNWKLHIDCYSERKMQFQELKDFILESSNCTVEANSAVTWITLRLFGGYNKAKGSYINLIVYLAYKQNETRPCKISTEWNLKELSLADDSDLKAYTKSLKNNDLLEGFRIMMRADHPVFSWSTEEQDNSPLELNNTSDSDEVSILDKVKPDRRKVMKKRQNPQRSKERSEKTKGKLMTKKSSLTVSMDENELHSLHKTGSPMLTSQETSQSVPLRRNKRLYPETASASDELGLKPGRKLRQTTISFQSSRARVLNSEKSKPAEAQKKPDSSPESVVKSKKKLPPKQQQPLVGILSAKKKVHKNLNQAVTSTPVRKRMSNQVKFVPIEDVEISPIVSDDEKDGK